MGNLVLNPVVLIFLALVAPGCWVAVRVVLGVLPAFGFSALVGHLVSRRRSAGDSGLPAAGASAGVLSAVG